MNTTTPQAKLDIVGDTLGLRNSAGWDNLWFTVDGGTANVNTSGAENGLNFKVGSNATGTYGNGQTLKTVMTMLPTGAVGVGTTTPDVSAILEVRSTDKGMLVPRVSTTQLLNIGNPAKGLLVYDATVGAFYYYNGVWTRVGDNLGDPQLRRPSTWRAMPFRTTVLPPALRWTTAAMLP